MFDSINCNERKRGAGKREGEPEQAPRGQEPAAVREWDKRGDVLLRDLFDELLPVGADFVRSARPRAPPAHPAGDHLGQPPLRPLRPGLPHLPPAPGGGVPAGRHLLPGSAVPAGVRGAAVLRDLRVRLPDQRVRLLPDRAVLPGGDHHQEQVLRGAVLGGALQEQLPQPPHGRRLPPRPHPPGLRSEPPADRAGHLRPLLLPLPRQPPPLRPRLPLGKPQNEQAPQAGTRHQAPRKGEGGPQGRPRRRTLPPQLRTVFNMISSPHHHITPLSPSLAEGPALRGALAQGVLEAADAVDGHQFLEADAGGDLGVLGPLGAEGPPPAVVVELSLQVGELGGQHQQFLLDVLLEAPEPVEHALDVELLLHLADALVDLGDEVAVDPQLVQLGLQGGDPLDGGVARNRVRHHLAHLLLVSLAALLGWGQQVADLHLLPELLYVALEGVHLPLQLQLPLLQGADRRVHFADLVRVQLLHEPHEVVAHPQVGHHLPHLGYLPRRRLPLRPHRLHFRLRVLGVLLQVFDFPVGLGEGQLEVAYFFFVLEFFLVEVLPAGEVDVHRVPDFVDPGCDLHHLDLQFLLELGGLALEVVDEGGVDAGLGHCLLEPVHQPHLCLLGGVLDVLLVDALAELHLAVVDLPEGVGLDLLELLLVAVVGEQDGLAQAPVLLALRLLGLLQLALQGLRLLAHLLPQLRLGLLHAPLQLAELLAEHPHHLPHLPHASPEAAAAVLELALLQLGLAPRGQLLEQGGVDVDAAGDLLQEVREGGLVELELHLPLELLRPLVGGLELEVELLDAVGELLVVDLELEPGDLRNVQHSLVHNKIINHTTPYTSGSHHSLPPHLPVLAVAVPAPQHQKGPLQRKHPYSPVQQHPALHFAQGVARVPTYPHQYCKITQEAEWQLPIKSKAESRMEIKALQQLYVADGRMRRRMAKARRWRGGALARARGSSARRGRQWLAWGGMSCIPILIFCNKYTITHYIMHHNEEWEIVESGPSFSGAELLTIKETLNTELSGFDYDGSIMKKAYKISRMLRYSLGKGYWQIIFVKAVHVRKLACSRNFYCIARKKDGLVGYIWVNRFMTEMEFEHQAMP